MSLLRELRRIYREVKALHDMGFFEEGVVMPDEMLAECGMALRFWESYFPTRDGTKWMIIHVGECLERHRYYVKVMKEMPDGTFIFEHGHY